jgi:hypothetical protein
MAVNDRLGIATAQPDDRLGGALVQLIEQRGLQGGQVSFNNIGGANQPGTRLLTILGHGSRTSIEGMNVNQITAQLTPRNFTHLELISCSTGGGRLAQQLANNLGVSVRAPSAITYTQRYVVAPFLVENGGQYLVFSPMNNLERAWYSFFGIV